MQLESTVSVVIPTHNRSDFLIKAVDSVLNQTYKKIEIVIINDYSSDNTKTVINKITKKYPSIVKSYSFRISVGASRARQKGIEMSSGEYIALLDDDDEWLPEKLSIQVNAIKNKQNIGAVTCWYYRKTQSNIVKVKLAENIKKQDIYWSNFLGSFSFVLIKKDILINNNIINTNLLSNQDWDFWVQTLKYTSVGIIPEYLVKYNEHNGNRITTNISKKVSGLNFFIKINESNMNIKQKEYLLAKLNNYISINKKEPFITRSKSKIISSLAYYRFGHPEYDNLFKLLINFIKYLTPNSLKSILKTKYKKDKFNEIHHHNDVYVLKNNITQYEYNSLNSRSEVISL